MRPGSDRSPTIWPAAASGPAWSSDRFFVDALGTVGKQAISRSASKPPTASSRTRTARRGRDRQSRPYMGGQLGGVVNYDLRYLVRQGQQGGGRRHSKAVAYGGTGAQLARRAASGWELWSAAPWRRIRHYRARHHQRAGRGDPDRPTRTLGWRRPRRPRDRDRHRQPDHEQCRLRLPVDASERRSGTPRCDTATSAFPAAVILRTARASTIFPIRSRATLRAAPDATAFTPPTTLVPAAFSDQQAPPFPTQWRVRPSLVRCWLGRRRTPTTRSIGFLDQRRCRCGRTRALSAAVDRPQVHGAQVSREHREPAHLLLDRRPGGRRTGGAARLGNGSPTYTS